MRFFDTDSTPVPWSGPSFKVGDDKPVVSWTIRWPPRPTESAVAAPTKRFVFSSKCGCSNLNPHQVARTPYGARAPSEPDVHVSAHPAQASVILVGKESVSFLGQTFLPPRGRPAPPNYRFGVDVASNSPGRDSLGEPPSYQKVTDLLEGSFLRDSEDSLTETLYNRHYGGVLRSVHSAR